MGEENESISMDHRSTNIECCFLRNKLNHISSEMWITLCKSAVKLMISTTVSGQAVVRDGVLYLTIAVFIASLGEVALHVCHSFYYALFTLAVLLAMLFIYYLVSTCFSVNSENFKKK